MATHFHIVVKQRKYALKQASFVRQRFVDQLVIDVDITRLPLDIGIQRDILNKFKAHLTGKLLQSVSAICQLLGINGVLLLMVLCFSGKELLSCAVLIFHYKTRHIHSVQIVC